MVYPASAVKSGEVEGKTSKPWFSILWWTLVTLRRSSWEGKELRKKWYGEQN